MASLDGNDQIQPYAKIERWVQVDCDTSIQSSGDTFVIRSVASDLP